MLIIAAGSQLDAGTPLGKPGLMVTWILRLIWQESWLGFRPPAPPKALIQSWSLAITANILIGRVVWALNPEDLVQRLARAWTGWTNPQVPSTQTRKRPVDILTSRWKSAYSGNIYPQQLQKPISRNVKDYSSEAKRRRNKPGIILFVTFILQFLGNTFPPSF